MEELGSFLPSSELTVSPPQPGSAPVLNPPPAASWEPDIRPSEFFEGKTDQCGGFILQCNLAFNWASLLFWLCPYCWHIQFSQRRGLPMDSCLSLLSPYWEFNLSRLFKGLLITHSTRRRQRRSCCHFGKGGCPFQNSPNASGSSQRSPDGEKRDWEVCLLIIFKKKDHIKDQLTTRDEPPYLGELIILAPWINPCLREQHKEKNSKSHEYPVSGVWTFAGHINPDPPKPVAVSELESMLTELTKLTAADRQSHISTKQCIYWCKSGHCIASCPACL